MSIGSVINIDLNEESQEITINVIPAATKILEEVNA